MSKSKKLSPSPDEVLAQMPRKNFAPNEYPSPLIYKLCEFYNAHPDYATSIVDVSILCRLAAQELDKFIHRPHKKVTQFYFDKDAPAVHAV